MPDAPDKANPATAAPGRPLRPGDTPPSSLLRQLVMFHVAIGLASLVIGGVVLYHTLNLVVWQQHRLGILSSGQEVLSRLASDGPVGVNRSLSIEGRRRFDATSGSMRFIVLDADRHIVSASPGAAPGLPRLQGGRLPESFEEGQDGSRLWGVTRRVETPVGPLDVQIAQDMERGYIVLDDVAPAALGPVLIVLALGAMLLLGANVGLWLWLLRPLRQAARQADAIGHGGSARLAEETIPVEVLPLIRGINGALDRLDDALAWQRGFSEEVAHELRTPLAVLLAELELLGGGPTTDRLRRDVQELAALVGDLLDAAEAARDQPIGDDIFDAVELATDIARRFRAAPGYEGREILAVAPNEPVWVRGNRDTMGRALRNLVENALSHSPAGAPVEMRLPPAGPQEVVIEVADRGPGVPVAQRQHVFRRSWRAGDVRRRGLGLGLSIVERITKAHGGRVEIGDNPGGGAVFALHLPRAAEAAVARAAAEEEI